MKTITDEFVLEERDDTRKVSHRLPARPRLRVETLAGAFRFDLIPVTMGKTVVPDLWVLPAEIAGVSRLGNVWSVEHASTEQMQERMGAHGCRCRVLRD